MKMHEATKSLSTDLPNEVRAFTIKASGKAFHALMSGLYADKTTAVLREIGSNCYDSHRAAGCAGRPFSVSLPGPLSPKLSIRDFGTGLSHEDVMGLYSTLFESPKEGSNDDVGCYGLGSKSPFAYTDNFSVIARDGVAKRVYACFLGTDGVPQITLLAAVECSEERGLEVSFAVRPEDYREFSEKANIVFAAFTVPPDMDGRVIPRPEVLLAGDDWDIVSLEGSTYGRELLIEQGCVRYPLDRGQINFTRFVGIGSQFILRVPIGAVSVTPSRESLSYDDETLAYLRSRVAEMEASIQNSIQAELVGMGNLSALERARMGRKLLRVLGNGVAAPTELKATQTLSLRGVKGHVRDLEVPIYRAKSGATTVIEHISYETSLTMDLMYLPDPNKRGVKGRLNEYVRAKGVHTVSTIEGLRRMVRLLGLTAAQVKTVADLPVPEKRGPAGSAGVAMSDYYVSSMKSGSQKWHRLRLDEVAADFVWAERGPGVFSDGLRIAIGDLDTIENVRRTYDPRPLYYVTEAKVSRQDPARAYSPKVVLTSPICLTWAMAAVQRDAIRRATNYETAKILTPHIEWFPNMVINEHMARCVMRAMPYDKLTEVANAIVKAARVKFPMLFPLNDAGITAYITSQESLDNPTTL